MTYPVVKTALVALFWIAHTLVIFGVIGTWEVSGWAILVLAAIWFVVPMLLLRAYFDRRTGLLLVVGACVVAWIAFYLGPALVRGTF